MTQTAAAAAAAAAGRRRSATAAFPRLHRWSLYFTAG